MSHSDTGPKFNFFFLEVWLYLLFIKLNMRYSSSSSSTVCTVYCVVYISSGRHSEKKKKLTGGCEGEEPKVRNSFIFSSSSSQGPLPPRSTRNICGLWNLNVSNRSKNDVLGHETAENITAFWRKSSQTNKKKPNKYHSLVFFFSLLMLHFLQR